MRGISLKLGTFTVFTVIITFWLAAIIGNINPFRETYTVRGVFSDATGVLAGDLVKIAGVEIGKVTGFRVDQGEAVVDMAIRQDVELPANVEAEMQFRNLLGQRVILLKRPESPSDKHLKDGDVIPLEQTEPALDLSVVFNNLRPLIHSTDPEDINTVARAVLEVFEGNEGRFAKIIRNLGEVSKTLAARDQRLARLISDLNEVTKVLNTRSTSIRVGLRRFSEFMASLAEVTPRIEDVVDQVDETSTKFGRVLVRNRSNLDRDLRDLATLLEIIDQNLGPLDRIAKQLKEVLLATARSQSYGRFWNLYVVNYCPETTIEQAPELPAGLGCRR